MCRIGMRVDRPVPSHKWIIMDTNVWTRGRERRGEERERGKKKSFHIIITFILLFIKYTV